MSMINQKNSDLRAFFVVLLLCFFSINGGAQQARFRSLKPFIPKGYTLLEKKQLSHQYILLILERRKNLKESFRFNIPIILIRKEKGYYINEGKYVTSELLPCGNEGFREVSVKGNTFTIEDDECGDWSHIYSCLSFRFDSQLHTYVLYSYKKTYIRGGDNDEDSSVELNHTIDRTIKYEETNDILSTLELTPESRKKYDRYKELIDNEE